MAKVKILFLSLGPLFAGYSDNSPNKRKYIQIGKWATGAYTHTTYSKDIIIPDESGFRFHRVFLPGWVRRFSLIRILWFTASIISHAYQQKRQNNSYDLIVAREPLVAGPIAILLAKMGGSKAIIEFNGNYQKAWEYSSSKKKLLQRWRIKYANLVVPLVLKKAAAAKLLFPSQIDGWYRKPDLKIFIFHDFVPISEFINSNHCKRPGRELLFMGFPWYLKGVDVLAEAYRNLCGDYEDVSLRIVCPMDEHGKFVLEKILRGCENVTVQNAVHYDEVPKMIGGCSVFVLPSRTEAMGRVLLEAMALRIPIVASDVDGIPYYVMHGSTGLLFEAGNARALEQSLRWVLENTEEANLLGERGFLRVQEELSEEKFSERYCSMAAEVLGADRQYFMNVSSQ